MDDSLPFYSNVDYCRLCAGSPGSMADNDPISDGFDIQSMHTATDWNPHLPMFSNENNEIFEDNRAEDDCVLDAENSENHFSTDWTQVRDNLLLSPMTTGNEYIFPVPKSSKRKKPAEEATPIGQQSKRDGRGNHWYKKAQQGKAFPQPSIGNTQWAKTVADMEAEHAALPCSTPLPWNLTVPVYPKTGNILKALYLTLLRLERDGAVRLTRAASCPAAGGAPESFFGITRVKVRQATRAAFDAGPFPSVDGLRQAGRPATDKDVKWAKKAWETAGLEEAPPYPGHPMLSFRFDARLRDKQRRQQQSQTRRVARRRAGGE